MKLSLAIGPDFIFPAELLESVSARLVEQEYIGLQL